MPANDDQLILKYIYRFSLFFFFGDISSLLDVIQSTVSVIIIKWKCLGTTETHLRSGRRVCEVTEQVTSAHCP